MYSTYIAGHGVSSDTPRLTRLHRPCVPHTWCPGVGAEHLDAEGTATCLLAVPRTLRATVAVGHLSESRPGGYHRNIRGRIPYQSIYSPSVWNLWHMNIGYYA